MQTFAHTQRVNFSLQTLAQTHSTLQNTNNSIQKHED